MSKKTRQDSLPLYKYLNLSSNYFRYPDFWLKKLKLSIFQILSWNLSIISGIKLEFELPYLCIKFSIRKSPNCFQNKRLGLHKDMSNTYFYIIFVYDNSMYCVKSTYVYVLYVWWEVLTLAVGAHAWRDFSAERAARASVSGVVAPWGSQTRTSQTIPVYFYIKTSSFNYFIYFTISKLLYQF